MTLEVTAMIFEPLADLEPRILYTYAKTMQDEANDNIEWGIAETILRFAGYRQMTLAAVNAADCELAKELADDND